MKLMLHKRYALTLVAEAKGFPAAVQAFHDRVRPNPCDEGDASGRYLIRLRCGQRRSS
jgi:hypothetical protein